MSPYERVKKNSGQPSGMREKWPQGELAPGTIPLNPVPPQRPDTSRPVGGFMQLLEPQASPAEEMGWIFAWVVTAPSSVPSWVQTDCKVHIKDLIEQILLTRVSVTLV